MSDTSEIGARLAGLSDAELVAAVFAATAGRAALGPLHSAAAALTHRHTDPDIDVTLTTSSASMHDAASAPAPSGQVGGISAVPPVPGPPSAAVVSPGDGGYTSRGVPTYESVRDKVEQRFGTAQGMGELDRQTPAGRSADEQWEAREKAARERLEQIRKSLHGNDVESNDP